MTAIADDHTSIKRRMRALGMSCPFDRPEYAREAAERDRKAELEEIQRRASEYGRWFYGGIPMGHP